MAAGDDAGAAGRAVVFQGVQRGGGEVALGVEVWAQQGERMVAEREVERAVVGDEVFAFAGGSERRGSFHNRCFEQQVALDRYGADRPGRLSAMAGERGESAGGGESFEVVAREVGAAGEIANVAKGALSGDALAGF